MSHRCVRESRGQLTVEIAAKGRVVGNPETRPPPNKLMVSRFWPVFGKTGTEACFLDLHPCRREHLALPRPQVGDAFARQRRHAGQLLIAERLVLSRGLDFNELA